ncbi:hypothetical protein M406DRAFT_328896 [Cryphonectria parasitica EP155]|uniref:NACHT domain-containing protein n=1 Tax=Cryphonectria parasitica (strain ATCC 38755 / EP155) TaxID=660469 RepID=A0A9P5CS14_CRYP1|nr:uncharacterized protein M406DRAFT_328896 [Cryphonectria parasitica EP155]KAF3767841.1 hypothetical protein M406DRAFT_328896 [Cryphonectria parasitica EP155]
MNMPRADAAAREGPPPVIKDKLRVLKSTIRHRFGKKTVPWQMLLTLPGRQAAVQALPSVAEVLQASSFAGEAPRREGGLYEYPELSEGRELYNLYWNQQGVGGPRHEERDYSVVSAAEAESVDMGPSIPRNMPPTPDTAVFGHTHTGYTTVPGNARLDNNVSGQTRLRNAVPVNNTVRRDTVAGNTVPSKPVLRRTRPGSTVSAGSTLPDSSRPRNTVLGNAAPRHNTLASKPAPGSIDPAHPVSPRNTSHGNVVTGPPVPPKDMPRSTGTGTQSPRNTVPSTTTPSSTVTDKITPGTITLPARASSGSIASSRARAVPGRIVPVNTFLGNEDPGRTFPGDIVPDKASTRNAIPGTVPDSSFPTNTVPEGTFSGNTTPGNTLPSIAVPGSVDSDHPSFDNTAPVHSAPRNFAPVDNAPVNTVPYKTTLWDQAYQRNKENQTKKEIVDEFERLLSKHMSSNQDDADIYKDSRLPHNKISADPRARRDQLEGIFRQHHFKKCSTTKAVLHNFGKVVSFFDDWISGAVQFSPHASLAWGVVRVFLPLLTNPVAQNEARLKAVTYVTMRSSYYAQLELIIQRVENKLERETMQGQLISLYEQMIDVQVRAVVHAFNQFKSAVKDTLGVGKWEESLERVKKLEIIINKDLKVLQNFADGNALTAILGNVNAAIGKIEGLSKVAHEQLLCEMKRNNTIMLEGMRVQQEHFDHLLSQEDMACLRALAPETASGQKSYVDLKDSVPDAVSGTCQWFLGQQQVKNWLDGQSHGILFLTANPGCGKSVLSKYMIDCVLPHEDSSSTICYFFFKERVQDSLAPAIASLLHQLLSQNDLLIKHAKEHVQKHKDIARSPSILWEIFLNAINDPAAGRLVFVIDALDECASEDIDRLVHKLRKLHTEREKAVRFLLTGRRSRQLNKAHKDLSNHCVKISADHFAAEIEQEVSLVTRTRIAEFCEDLSTSAQRSLEARLLGQGRHPDRTYLWVHLVFEYLNQADHIPPTPKGIEKELQHLPRTVEDAYENLLQQSLSKSYAANADVATDLVRRAFCILLAAHRPLTVPEMREAMAMEQDLDTMAYPGRLADLDLEESDEDFAVRLNQQCGLMLSISSGTVTFFHQTVIDFLLPSKHILWLYAFVGLDFAIINELEARQTDAEDHGDLLKTALLIAMMNGHGSTIEILYNHGADINMKFGNKWSSNKRGSGQT